MLISFQLTKFIFFILVPRFYITGIISLSLIFTTKDTTYLISFFFYHIHKNKRFYRTADQTLFNVRVR